MKNMGTEDLASLPEEHTTEADSIIIQKIFRLLRTEVPLDEIDCLELEKSIIEFIFTDKDLYTMLYLRHIVKIKRKEIAEYLVNGTDEYDRRLKAFKLVIRELAEESGLKEPGLMHLNLDYHERVLLRQYGYRTERQYYNSTVAVLIWRMEDGASIQAKRKLLKSAGHNCSVDKLKRILDAKNMMENVLETYGINDGQDNVYSNEAEWFIKNTAIRHGLILEGKCRYIIKLMNQVDAWLPTAIGMDNISTSAFIFDYYCTSMTDGQLMEKYGLRHLELEEISDSLKEHLTSLCKRIRGKEPFDGNILVACG